MGILEDLLASAMGGGQGMDSQDPREASTRGRAQPPAQAGGGGMGSIMMALLPVILSMLASRGAGPQGGAGGGLGDLLGQVLGGGGAQRGGGGLEDLLGQVLGGGGGGGGGGMGGLGGLLEQMARAGYGDQARSWVGTGQNMPIPPDAIEQIFGHGGLAEIAHRAGVSEADASRGLSELLPEVVDRVTPAGQVPDLDHLAASVSDLSRKLGLG